MTAWDVAVARTARSGWSWGTFIGSTEWLTIPGSHWESAPLYPEPDAVPARTWANIITREPDTVALAKVQRIGRSAFAVIEVARTLSPLAERAARVVQLSKLTPDQVAAESGLEVAELRAVLDGTRPLAQDQAARIAEVCGITLALLQSA